MLAGCWSPSSGLKGDWGEASKFGDARAERSEDASPRDGGQGHRAPGTTRLFPESGQGGAGGSRQDAQLWDRAVRETRLRDRDGAESRVHPQRQGDSPAGPGLPREAPVHRRRASEALGPQQLSALPFPVARPARPHGGGPCAAWRRRSATRRRPRALGGAGSAPVASETGLCFRGRGHDSLGFRRRTRWCCGRHDCGTLGRGPTPQFCMSVLRGWGELPGDGKLDLSPGPGGAGGRGS